MPPKRSPIDEDPVAGALRLRRLALRLLAVPEPADAESWRGVGDVPESGWRLFLAVERCALALRSALDRAGARRRVPAPAREILDARATVELQRILSAGAQLRSIGRFAEESGWRVVVLKGGVPIAAGRHGIDVHDVDVLLDDRDAHGLAARLDAAGYRAGPHGISHHLPGRMAEASIPVDVHLGLEAFASRGVGDVRSAVRPIEALPSLLRPAPPDHVAYLVTHSVAQHPWRQGTLRDLLLVADGVAECAAAELARVERRLREQPRGEAMAALLAMAGAVARGAVPDDAFAGTAAVNYALNAGRAPRAPGPQLEVIRALALFTAVRRGVEVSEYLRQAMAPPGPRPHHPVLRLLYGVSPRLSLAVRSVGRPAFYVAALLAAAPGAWRVRRRLRRLGIDAAA